MPTVATADTKCEMSEPGPTFSACPSCGAAVHRDESAGHVCDEARQLVLAELKAFDAELGEWLETPHGRFAAWLAERGRAA